MELLWFCIVAFMIAMYVILDGFDLGAGILHRLIGKTEEERRMIIKAIGPVWDGNEVWILAAGGTLYFAFPLLYASSFSGFYLPLTMVLWLLMLRGLGIELRHQVHHPMWLSFWDTVFSFSSILLAIFFGAALGNVVRGVPLNEEGYFFEPLWTSFTPEANAGILDWFTVTMGLVALCTLTLHGAHYIAMKTDGVLQSRARAVARKALWGTVATSLIAFWATFHIHPEFWDNYTEHFWGFIFPLAGLAGLVGSWYFGRTGKDVATFFSSTAFIAGMLASTAFALFPLVLPASTDPKFSLTVYNTTPHEYGLSIGIVWWIIGMIFATAYFVYVYRSFRGKVSLHTNDLGY
jgi:cytochrome d ubiquinol oxidase subunit II